MTNRGHWRLIAASGTCVLALAACARGTEGTGNSGAAAGQAVGWVEPSAYEYTVDSRCGEQFLIGRFTLTVANGEVTRVVGGDAESVRALEWMKLDSFPTLGELLKEVQQARSEDADVADVAFDPVDGHPAKIRIDHNKGAIDDESCYDILGFTAT